MALSSRVRNDIDAVFAAAHAGGRSTLHEHEVYSILGALGLGVPSHAFIRDPGEVNAALLGRFPGDAVIVKVVSRNLAHKQRYGGVRKVASQDPLFVRYVMSAMRDDVLSHFEEGKKPAIDGFLVVEFIRFTQALGNELMIGLKADRAFGPVLTMTKGGDDAEFFAKYYDPANLMLAPVRYEDAQALTRSLKIRHRFEETGHPEYLDMMARAATMVGELGRHYSFISPQTPRWYIETLDVNPFVFSGDGRLVAVDGYAEFTPQACCADVRREPDTENLRKFFSPSGVAVMGVSTDATRYSMARVIAGLLHDMGRRDIRCVNPKGGETEINGVSFPLYRGLEEIPGEIDLVVYAAPAGHTLDTIAGLPEGVAAIVISGIPADIRYADFARAVHESKPAGTRIIGPNCMGVFYAPADGSPGVNTLFLEDSRLRIPFGARSNCALLTQSGAMGITSVERNQHSRIFRAIVSFGNKVDVNVPDLLAHFEEDPSVDVLAIYLEGLGEGEGRRFFDVASRSEKPVLVYKSGRTEAGMKAAVSHTASMSGSYDVFRAASGQAGCVLLEELDDFYNCMKAFSMLQGRRPAGRRVAGVVNAGLDATMGADTLQCLTQATLRPETVEKLKRLNTHGLVDTGTSFLDLTPMTGDALYVDFVNAVLDDPDVDCLFVAIVPHVENLKTTNDICLMPDAIAPLLVEASRRTDKPVVVSVNAGQYYQRMVQFLEESGLPVYGDIRSAIRSLDRFAAYWAKKR